MIRWKEFLENMRNGWKKKSIRKDHLLILFLAGVLLLVIALPTEEKEGQRGEKLREEESETTDVPAEEYSMALERRLEELLSQIDGAGDVSVMVTLQSTAEKVVEKDTEENSETVTEKDSQGGNRTTRNTERREETVYDEEKSEGQIPYVRKELSPKVEGVVVISPGGDQPVVIKNITEAVQALFDIDTHKIRIVKGRREI